jgi:hypothetical protein
MEKLMTLTMGRGSEDDEFIIKEVPRPAFRRDPCPLGTAD